QRRALGPAEDEVVRPALEMVAPILLVQLLEPGHASSVVGPPQGRRFLARKASNMRSSLATKPAPPADQSTLPAGPRPTPVPVDIRAAKPYPFAQRSFRQLVLRLGSVAALVALDLTALGLGLYAALVLREFYYGVAPGDILWSFLWTDTEASYLPFSAIVL